MRFGSFPASACETLGSMPVGAIETTSPWCNRLDREAGDRIAPARTHGAAICGNSTAALCPALTWR